MAIFARKQDSKRSDVRSKTDLVSDSVSVEIGAPVTEPPASESPVAEAGVVTPVLVETAVVREPVVESTVVQPTVVVAAGAQRPEVAGRTVSGTTGGVGTEGATPRPTATAGPAGVGSAAAGPMDSVDIEEDIEPLELEAPVAGGPPPFGIADAIQLMRSLPADPNIDLVVRVVRVTLGAVNVSIEEIMEDARRKEGRIQQVISVLEGEVSELEKQVYARRCEIAAHQADMQETANVRERLYQADKYNGHRPPPMPPDAARVAHPTKPADWSNSDQHKGNG